MCGSLRDHSAFAYLTLNVGLRAAQGELTEHRKLKDTLDNSSNCMQTRPYIKAMVFFLLLSLKV